MKSSRITGKMNMPKLLLDRHQWEPMFNLTPIYNDELTFEDTIDGIAEIWFEDTNAMRSLAATKEYNCLLYTSPSPRDAS